MTIRTVNPYIERTLHEYHEESLDEVRAKITGLRKAQQEWKLDLDARMQALKEVRTRFASASNKLGILMSTEMGKPVSQSEAELKKCLWTLDSVIEHAATFLAPEEVKQ